MSLFAELLQGLRDRPACWVLLFASFCPGAVHAQSQRTLTLAQAVDIAVARAPELAAREAAVDGAAAAQVSAGRLPDPRLGLGLENVPVTGADAFSLTADFMTMAKVGWMQEVPNRGKRKAQVEVALALTERERAVLAAERQAVKRKATVAWLARYFAEKRLATLAALERENRVLQSTVNARVAAGRALPADATMARQEALQLADRRDELVAELARTQAALARWIGDAADATLAGPPEALVVDPQHLRENLAQHVELAAFAPMSRMAQAQVREAEAAKKGDWAWEVSYAQRGPSFSNMVSLQVAFELPLFNATRRDPQILAKRKELQRIEAEREEMLRKHTEEIQGELAGNEELTRKLERLRGSALALARERVRLQMASYQAGRVDLGGVLTARRDLVETELKAIDTEAALYALRARLAYLIAEHRP